MDAAISSFRAEQSSGIHALDAASPIVNDASNENTTNEEVRPTPRDVDRHVPRRPDRVQLAVLTVLTALADTYGAEMMTNSSLGYALRLIAGNGGIALAQRVLFGESAADQQLSAMLTATRVALTQVSALFAEEFFAEADALFAGFRPQTPNGFKSPSSGRNE
jgi:hypothetical protein